MCSYLCRSAIFFVSNVISKPHELADAKLQWNWCETHMSKFRRTTLADLFISPRVITYSCSHLQYVTSVAMSRECGKCIWVLSHFGLVNYVSTFSRWIGGFAMFASVCNISWFPLYSWMTIQWCQVPDSLTIHWMW